MIEDGRSVARRATLLALMVGAIAIAAAGDVYATVMCPPGGSGSAALPRGGHGEYLEGRGTRTVSAGDYTYGNVNIYGTEEAPATLKFKDARINFSAHSILVENYGYLLAGWSSSMGKPRPIGTRARSKLTIKIYGAEGDPPITCKSGPTCGVDPAIWNSNADPRKPPVQSMLPSGTDYFYNYDVMPL